MDNNFGDNYTHCWLDKIADDLVDIKDIFKTFLKNPTEDNLKILVNHKEYINKASKKIAKFFEKNYRELPRKFTEARKDGSNFNAILDNTVGDAEEVLEYLNS